MTESHFRSIIKGVSWRVIGTLDTIIISFFTLGELNTALKIGVSDVLTKFVLYYLHERAWLYIIKEHDQSPRISIFKAITWRIVGTLDTIVLSWFYSGNPWAGITIGTVEIITKTILYYWHERMWHKVPLGTVRRWFGIKKDKA